MNKEAFLQETYDSAFNDELEKISSTKLENTAKLLAAGGLGIGIGMGVLKGVEKLIYPNGKPYRIGLKEGGRKSLAYPKGKPYRITIKKNNQDD